MTRAPYVALIWLWLVATATAQASRNLIIQPPPGVPSESVQITYGLQGSLGGHGESVRSIPDVTSYPIPVEVEGKVADRLLLVAWMPGCETRTYDLRPKKSGERRLDLECAILPAVILTGRIQPFDLIAGKPAELVVWFQAWWECQFFGWLDCMVPQFEVATATPKPDGTFQVRLPDFGSDPVVNSFKSPAGMSGEFRFVVRDPKTWNPIADLEPEIADFRAPDGTLKVLSAYPSGLVFKANLTH